jgi:hypothetical protein
MNLFRSEDHIRGWAQFKEGTEEGIIPLEDLLKPFSVGLFRKRLDPDYVSQRKEYIKEFVATLVEIGKTGQFWQRPKA